MVDFDPIFTKSEISLSCFWYLPNLINSDFILSRREKTHQMFKMRNSDGSDTSVKWDSSMLLLLLQHQPVMVCELRRAAVLALLRPVADAPDVFS